MSIEIQGDNINLRFVTSWEAEEDKKRISIFVIGEGVKLFVYDSLMEFKHDLDNLIKKWSIYNEDFS